MTATDSSSPGAASGAASAPGPRPLVSVRESLGSRLAFESGNSPVLVVPSAALVLVQEFTTGLGYSGLVVLSLVAQQALRGILLLGLAVLVRRARRVLPLPVGLAAWAILGLSRGLVGGEIAARLDGIEPEFEFRIAFWVFIALVWEPLGLHTIAQLRARRGLLTELTGEVTLRDEARRQAERTSSEIREHLIRAVQESIEPAVDEIKRSLRVVSPTVDAERIRLIGERLAGVSSQSTRMVQRLSAPPERAPTKSGGGTPLVTALDFEYRRPVLSVTLGALALLALIVPLSLHRQPQLEFLLQIVVSVGVSALGMLIAFGVQGKQRRAMTGLGSALLRYFVAGLLASTALLLFRFQELSGFDLSLLTVLPFGAVVSSTTVAAAVGLPESNRALSAMIGEVENERRLLEEAALSEENQVRTQLSELMHGPIQGRLAACAMALNFHSAEVGTAPPDRTDFITKTVLDHLEAASDDLAGLSCGTET